MDDLPVVHTADSDNLLTGFTNVDPIVAKLSRAKKLEFLATNGGPVLLSPAFIANNGSGISAMSADSAPPPAMSLHFARAQAKGRGIVLPLKDAIACCAAQNIPLHISDAFIRWKDERSPLGRLISNYSCGGECSLNNPSKKDALAKLWAPIRNPSAADLCQLYLNALASHPAGTSIECVRIDISDAYPRVRTCPSDVPETARLFGSQDSNFQWQPIIDEVLSRLLVFDVATYGVQGPLPTRMI